jgi:type I restriction enzyme S subunit
MEEKQVNIPDGWMEESLGNILNYEQPYKYTVDSTDYNDRSGIPVLTAGKSFILGYTTEQHNVYKNTPVIIFDDFTTDSKFVDFPFKVKSSAMKFLKPKNSEEFDIKIIFGHLQNLKIRETGGDHKRRWISEFSKLKVVLPPFTEQTTIARILSKVDEAIAQTEQLIAKYTRIKTGLMQDLLTKGIDEHGNIRNEETHEFKDSPLGRIPKEWECLTIGDIAERLRSGVTPKGGSDVYQKEGIMLIRSQNVYSYGFKLDDIAYISEEINSRMLGSQLQAFDVLLNITGASIGRSTFLPENHPLSNVNQHVCAIRLKNTSLEKAIYLSSFLNSVYGQNQIQQNNAGSNREGINYNQIRAILIPWFKREREFESFKNIISKTNEKIESLNISIFKLQSLKTGLMQDLLSGKVRVKVSEL